MYKESKLKKIFHTNLTSSLTDSVTELGHLKCAICHAEEKLLRSWTYSGNLRVHTQPLCKFQERKCCTNGNVMCIAVVAGPWVLFMAFTVSMHVSLNSCILKKKKQKNKTLATPLYFKLTLYITEANGMCILCTKIFIARSFF